MKFSRLRLLGFKSFVEPTDVPIETGLTGIVGPNGCGKSNLVEALQWVMGESSYKAMRAAGMDEVIFSGSAGRPARNTAEVTLAIDNADRSAPAAFNDGDVIEVTRRIEREEGSTYRVNGREVRARDVQLLFADAAAGAHSPAMVGQGRVGALISAKPQARRAVLEGAAGIAGLHGRRHDAEQRLTAAEQNLDRVEDVLAEIERQLEALRKQARQAVRYRSLSGEIRKGEATAVVLRHRLAADAAREAEAEQSAAAAVAGERAEAEARAGRDQSVAAAAIAGLRDAAAAASAAVQRLRQELSDLDAEEQRIAARVAELTRRRDQCATDLDRERRVLADNEAAVARLATESAELTAADRASGERRTAAAGALAAAESKLVDSERRVADAARLLAEHRARAAQLRKAADDAAARGRRAEAELAGVAKSRAALDNTGLDGRVETTAAVVVAAEAALATAEAAATKAETAVAAARERETAARAARAEADSALAKAETEQRTLATLVSPATSGRPLIDRLTVRPGYEAALAAAVGGGLTHTDDPKAASHWLLVPAAADDPPLPEGATPLAAMVESPPVLIRRLAQTGIVPRADGPRLQQALRTGQILVSVEGDVWRWDGFVSAAGAPGSEATRLAGRNRLADLARTVDTLRRAAEYARTKFADARVDSETAATADAAARDALRRARIALDSARADAAAAERDRGRIGAQAAALAEAAARLGTQQQEAAAEAAAATAALAGLAPPDEAAAAALNAEMAGDRRAAADSRAALAGLDREAGLRTARLSAIAREDADWRQRRTWAEAQIAALGQRRTEAEAELAGLADAPAAIAVRRVALTEAADRAEAARRAAADALAAAESALAAADKAAAAAREAMADAREARGRADERLAAARRRLAEFAALIAEHFDSTPEEAAAAVGLDRGTPPALDQVEARVERLKQERERLGGVNLQAETEAEELAKRRDAMVADRDDLVAAIRKLRDGIASLNREGRERLRAAFDSVNARFKQLFIHLFGGGEAELRFTDSEDPLEAGLEIFARPPGKKLTTMTLMSGGEQALTALSLIFAVFMTNPAPICVLDEVDAPLDDANVERFCALLEEMTRQTQTRFLVITHNPITMARMNRLYGVTMAERGVSTLVSVDLDDAERFREAG